MKHISVYCILLCFIFHIVSGDDAHLICKQVKDVFALESPPSHVPPTITQGKPGKRGQQGPKGEPGEVGPQGQVATVNYDRIQTAVFDRVSEDINTLVQKFDTLSAKINNIDERLSDVEVSTVLCGVTHNGKCFRAILHDIQDVQLDEAKSMCENIGWKLANIYDAAHYQKVENYLRGKIPSSRSWNTAWLGMTFNTQARETFYSNGSRADMAGIKWLSGYPTTKSAYTKVGIHIGKSSSSNSGIHNHPSTSNRLGPICEL